jgi:hypothetical protein
MGEEWANCYCPARMTATTTERNAEHLSNYRTSLNGCSMSLVVLHTIAAVDNRYRQPAQNHLFGGGEEMAEKYGRMSGRDSRYATFCRT